MPNALADALSPYLRQHADNPVDWQQWGQTAFDEAARRDVPVLVSVGYSTCHWCHVMARESFSDPEIAAYLNENFVAIKVDREEHPEVDASYMAVAGAFTENLGWPLNVFATPSGRAFFAGTYWPPQAIPGRPSFRQVLEGVTDAWLNRRDGIESSAAEVAAAFAELAARPASPLPTTDRLDEVVTALARYEDAEFGGFGTAPKFPVVPVLGFLQRFPSAEASALAGRTLTSMANSDLRDEVEGGYFRYSTRRDWSEPHYERMLYDNAQLLAAYATLSVQSPDNADAAAAAAGIVDFLSTVLRLPSGGFAAAQNSESLVDGELTEGDYYSLDAVQRSKQPRPALDDKVLTGWNGLAIGALAYAGFHCGEPDWVELAREEATGLLTSQIQESGELVRATLGGIPSLARATLEDYGLLAQGFLNLAQATGDVEWAVHARGLVDACITAAAKTVEATSTAAPTSTAATNTAAASTAAPFAVPGGGDPVLAAQGLAGASDPNEGAYPSGVSAIATAADRLYLLTGDHSYRAAARAAMESVAEGAVNQPMGFGAALSLMTDLEAPVAQLVVVAPGSDSHSDVVGYAKAWLRPGSVVAIVTSEQATQWADAGFELFEGRTARDDSATAYLCRDFVCQLPVTDVDELRLIAGASTGVVDEG